MPNWVDILVNSGREGWESGRRRKERILDAQLRNEQIEKEYGLRAMLADRNYGNQRGLAILNNQHALGQLDHGHGLTLKELEARNKNETDFYKNVQLPGQLHLEGVRHDNSMAHLAANLAGQERIARGARNADLRDQFLPLFENTTQNAVERGIEAGTQLASFKGWNPYLEEDPDRENPNFNLFKFLGLTNKHGAPITSLTPSGHIAGGRRSGRRTTPIAGHTDPRLSNFNFNPYITGVSSLLSTFNSGEKILDQVRRGEISVDQARTQFTKSREANESFLEQMGIDPRNPNLESVIHNPIGRLSGQDIFLDKPSLSKIISAALYTDDYLSQLDQALTYGKRLGLGRQ